MDPSTPLTYEFVRLVAGVVFAFAGGCITVVLWLQRILSRQEERLVAAIAASRTAGDRKIEELEAKIEAQAQSSQVRVDGLAERFRVHEISTLKELQECLSKTSANTVFARIEASIERSYERLETRLVRIEAWQQPHGGMMRELHKLQEKKG